MFMDIDTISVKIKKKNPAIFLAGFFSIIFSLL